MQQFIALSYDIYDERTNQSGEMDTLLNSFIEQRDIIRERLKHELFEEL